MPQSNLERSLLFQIRALGLPAPETDHRFHPTRRWRFDGAYPDRLIAYEVEGGTWSGGRHVRGKGFERDCIKYNEAALLGWRVLRFTGAMVEDGRAVEILERALIQPQESDSGK